MKGTIKLLIFDFNHTLCSKKLSGLYLDNIDEFVKDYPDKKSVRSLFIDFDKIKKIFTECRENGIEIGIASFSFQNIVEECIKKSYGFDLIPKKNIYCTNDIEDDNEDCRDPTCDVIAKQDKRTGVIKKDHFCKNKLIKKLMKQYNVTDPKEVVYIDNRVEFTYQAIHLLGVNGYVNPKGNLTHEYLKSILSSYRPFYDKKMGGGIPSIKILILDFDKTFSRYTMTYEHSNHEYFMKCFPDKKTLIRERIVDFCKIKKFFTECRKRGIEICIASFNNEWVIQKTVEMSYGFDLIPKKNIFCTSGIFTHQSSNCIDNHCDVIELKDESVSPPTYVSGRLCKNKLIQKAMSQFGCTNPKEVVYIDNNLKYAYNADRYTNVNTFVSPESKLSYDYLEHILQEFSPFDDILLASKRQIKCLVFDFDLCLCNRNLSDEYGDNIEEFIKDYPSKKKKMELFSDFCKIRSFFIKCKDKGIHIFIASFSSENIVCECIKHTYGYDIIPKENIHCTNGVKGKPQATHPKCKIVKESDYKPGQINGPFISDRICKNTLLENIMRGITNVKPCEIMYFDDEELNNCQAKDMLGIHVYTNEEYGLTYGNITNALKEFSPFEKIFIQ